jgi:hypothetical protein
MTGNLNNLTGASGTSSKRKDAEKPDYKKAPICYQTLKQQVKKGGKVAVISYKEYIEFLLYIHKENSEPLNWENLTNMPEPGLPSRASAQEDLAELEYRAYKPKFLDIMLGRRNHRRKELLKKIELAKREDDLTYNFTLKQFKKNQQDWTELQSISKGIREENPNAYRKAIDFFDPFQQIGQLGSKLKCEVFREYIIVNLHISSKEIVPDYVLSQTVSGKITKTKMPLSKFNELYHQHLCGCVLRIGRETFALLPVKAVFVHAYSSLPDANTGRSEHKVILSVKFNPADLLKLNFKTLSGPDGLANFPHQLDFSVIKGFSAVPALTN